MSLLSKLKKMTTVVVDTGDIESIKKHTPTDATTNPSLIFSAIEQPAYASLLEEAFEYSKQAPTHGSQLSWLMDQLYVNVGREILRFIPGRVSTEVDARLSFDVQGSVLKAYRLIDLYEKSGISRDRILIKLASTWEGGIAAKRLERDGIHCNMTLMFSLPQAIHCAEAGATLVSPFVGRILDWHLKNSGVSSYAPELDPGVLSVKKIYYYFKKYGYSTQVMGASFRNVEEITALAGCDLLTIAPKFLEMLDKTEGSLECQLDPETAKQLELPRLDFNEQLFRFLLNDDQMATDKLAEGIRVFAADAIKLEQFLKKKFNI